MIRSRSYRRSHGCSQAGVAGELGRAGHDRGFTASDHTAKSRLAPPRQVDGELVEWDIPSEPESELPQPQLAEEIAERGYDGGMGEEEQNQTGRAKSLANLRPPFARGQNNHRGGREDRPAEREKSQLRGAGARTGAL